MGASRRGDQPGGEPTAPPLTEFLPLPGCLPRHIWGRLARLEAPKNQGCLGTTLPGGAGGSSLQGWRAEGEGFASRPRRAAVSVLQGERGVENARDRPCWGHCQIRE